MGKLRSATLNLGARHNAFAYQQEAVDAVRDLPYSAVFHEQGLGKTKIAIDVLLYWLEIAAVDTVLVVAKKSLVSNWKRELSTHTHLKPRLLTQSRKANYHTFNSPARLILAHFEVFVAEFDRFRLFLQSRDVGVILDESAKIKNPQARVSQSLHSLSPLFKKRMIMTGTPVANRPYDIWSQVFFLDEGQSLGTDFETFKHDMDLTSDLSKDEVLQTEFEQRLDGLFDRISAFSVRETKDGGRIELPEKVVNVVDCTWEHYQQDLYLQYKESLRAIVMRNGIPSEDKAEGVLKRILRLVQIASNPKLVDQSYSCDPGKLSYLVDLVQQVTDAGEKCIVWSSFNENVDWLAKRLSTFGTCKLHGRMPMERRDRSVEHFINDGSVKVLVATPGVAKEGLTLTVANHVMFYDRGFSLDDYLQAQDRIHRISQTRTCHVHNFLMPDSVDEWVDVLLAAKHMAARLAQGDIDIDAYRQNMTYSFGDILQEVLGTPETDQ